MTIETTGDLVEENLLRVVALFGNASQPGLIAGVFVVLNGGLMSKREAVLIGGALV